MHKILFLINPNSGGNTASRLISALMEVSVIQNIVVEKLDFNNFLAQISKAKDYETIVIGGGDGTISSLLPYLIDHPRVGVLPLGTGNDLARELGIKAKIELDNVISVINFYRTNSTRQFSLGLIKYGQGFDQETYFINYISIGYDAKVVGDFAKLRELALFRKFKSIWINRISYFIVSLFSFGYRLPNKISIINNDTKDVYQAGYKKSILIANIRSIMGLGQSNSFGSAFDEKIEAIVIKNPLEYASMLIKSIPLMFRPEYLGQAKVWKIMGGNCVFDIQVDGEPRADLVSNQMEISIGAKINLISLI